LVSIELSYAVELRDLMAYLIVRNQSLLCQYSVSVTEMMHASIEFEISALSWWTLRIVFSWFVWNTLPLCSRLWFVSCLDYSVVRWNMILRFQSQMRYTQPALTA